MAPLSLVTAPPPSSVKPWPVVVGPVVAALGLALVASSFSSAMATSVRLPLTHALGWAFLELGAGASLQRRRGSGTAQLVSGGTNLAVAALVWFLAAVPSFSASPQAIVLLLGLSCASGALVRALDVLVLRRRLSWPGLLGALLFGALSAWALSTWRDATVTSVARLVGSVVGVGALALTASANRQDDVGAVAHSPR